MKRFYILLYSLSFCASACSNDTPSKSGLAPETLAPETVRTSTSPSWDMQKRHNIPSDEIGMVIAKAESGNMDAARRLVDFYSTRLTREDTERSYRWIIWLADRGDASSLSIRASILHSKSFYLSDSSPVKIALLESSRAYEILARINGGFVEGCIVGLKNTETELKRLGRSRGDFGNYSTRCKNP